MQQGRALSDPKLLPIQVSPDPVITPGEAQIISLAEIKKRRFGAARLSNIPAEAKRAVFLAYGLSVDEKNYEASNWPKAYRKYIDKTAPILPERNAHKLSISAAQSSSKN